MSGTEELQAALASTLYDGGNSSRGTDSSLNKRKRDDMEISSALPTLPTYAELYHSVMILEDLHYCKLIDKAMFEDGVMMLFLQSDDVTRKWYNTSHGLTSRGAKAAFARNSVVKFLENNAL